MRPISILFPQTAPSLEHQFPGEDPSFFVDLAIDRILEVVSAGFEPYDLRPLFRLIPHERTTIDYRQAILRDLADNIINAVVKDFTAAMVRARSRLELARKCFNKHQEAAYFVGAIIGYCKSVQTLGAALVAAGPQSDGLQTLTAVTHEYINSDSFKFLAEEAIRHRAALDAIRYTVLIHQDTVTVRGFEEQPDYNAVISQLFARFQKQDDAPRTSGAITNRIIGNVQSRILDAVVQLHPEIFAALGAFVNAHRDFIDPVLVGFEREAQFYLSWLAFTDKLAATGLDFCWPQLIDDYGIGAEAAFDLALAEKLHGGSVKIVANDFYLEGAERIFIVTGPNQGGKTTFARMLGQMHLFGNLGLTVPGRQVRLKFFDRIFTHFEREESLTSLHGKLYDDLLRIHAILDAATADSLIVLNEIFNSTALKDAVFLADAVLRRIIRLGALGVCVTFMDELATIGPETVSVTSMVEPENPETRSFHIIRHQADGLAYALSIAKKYGVTYDRLKERL
jgi:hypothetical protein